LNVDWFIRKLEDNEMAFRFNLSRLLRLVLCAVVVLSAFGSQRLHAQAVGATLAGTVTDASGSVVPKAAVAILNTATGETRSVDTNADGLYSAPNLQPGNYSVTVTADGFSKVVQSGVVLSVGGSQTLNISLQVGQTSQTVEVTAEAPTVNLTNAEIGGLTTEASIKELPLNGRSWSDLANLTSGVYQLHTQPNLESRDRFTRGYGIQLSISGARPQQNNYRVDGISINDPGNGGPGSVLGTNAGVDAVAEFSVLTTNYSTEYGRASGGIINATTKSGTNAFHGTAYEFLRNSWFDAPNFFDPNGVTPPFRRNQFGVSGGGPIIKDKTFVFGDYEGLRQALGISRTSQVPSVTGAAGADSAVAPYIAALFPVGGVLGGKTVCTITATSDPFHDNCSFGANQVSTENYFILRGDHNISTNDRLSSTFFRDKANTGTPDNYNNQVVNTATSEIFATVAETHTFSANLFNSLRVGYNRDTQGGPAGATALNSAASNTAFGIFAGLDAPQVAIGSANAIKFSGGVTSNSPQINTWNSYQLYDDAFWTKGKHSFKFGGNIENIRLNVIRSPRPGGIFAYSSWADFLNNCGAQATANCSGLSGTASITTDIPGSLAPEEMRQTIFGMYFQDDYKLRQNLTINMGLRYEPTTVVSDPKGRNATLDTIYFPGTGQLPLCGIAFAGTCNARNGPLYGNNTLHDFDPRVGFAWDPQSNGKMSVRGGFGLYDQLPLPAFMGSTSNGNTAPFLVSGSNSNLATGSFGEFSSFGPCPAPPTGGAAWAQGTSTACQVSAAGANRVAFIERAPKRAYVMQYNLSIERQIARDTTLMVGYVGSHGLHGTTQVDDVNEVLPTKIGGNYYWPCEAPGNPFLGGNSANCPAIGSGSKINGSWGRLPATFFRNSSLYNGLQAQLNKRMSYGFQASVGFTWQKSIDTASGAVISDSVVTAISTQNWFDPKLTRGVSDFNDSKVLTVNYLWDIPTPKSWSGFTRSAAGGWELGGIFSASSGQPFTPLLAEGDVLGQNNTDPFAYPNRIPSCGNNLTNPGNVNNYIKLQCFVVPPVANVNGVNYIQLGNAGRNILEGPGLVDFDFSVVKNTKITRISDAFNVQFRLDVFNLFNRANFNPPVTNMFIMTPAKVTSGTVASPGPTGPCTADNLGNSGCVAGAGAFDGGDMTSTSSRQMQLSVKIIW
jgi:hypothetical protein